MRWELIGKVVTVVGPTIGLILTGTGLILTALQNEHDVRVNSATLAIQLDERLMKSPLYSVISHAYDAPDKGFLREKAGPISDDDLEQVMGTYDTVYHLRREGLIDERLTYNVFCADVETLAAKKEVIDYLAETRKDPAMADAYAGFTRLDGVCRSFDRRSDALEH